MTDHKFTDDDVIKALECHADEQNACAVCPYRERGGCSLGMSSAALDLINRQTAEIESLQAVNADIYKSLRLAAEVNKDMQAEIERLKNPIFALYVDELTDESIEVLKQQPFLILPENNEEVVFFDESKIKAEAIKEFAERLIDKCSDPHWCVWMSEIEDLVKEMTEGKENESQST